MPGLKDLIEKYAEGLGYIKTTDEYGWETWTHPEWKDWWRDPRTEETSDRHVSFDKLVSWIVYEEESSECCPPPESSHEA